MNPALLLKNIFLLIISIWGSHFFAVSFGSILSHFIDIGGSIGGNKLEYYIFGFPVAYLFFAGVLFSAFENKYKYWWISISSILVLLFEIALAPILMLFSVPIFGFALLLGILINKTLTTLAPKFMAKIS